MHGSDTGAYSILDSKKGKLPPRNFPRASVVEPTLQLVDALGGGNAATNVVKAITGTGQVVFHAVGDTGNTRGPKDQNEVADKMVSDFRDTVTSGVPSFLYHLGDVVYSFGEAAYYYDQYYEPYRDYPAPIFAIPGNHDGMVSPLTPNVDPLTTFIANFCAPGDPHRTSEAGNLPRTAQIQPAIYFTLEAPFVRILGLYSNCLEDPGIISDQGSSTYSFLGTTQVDYLKAALTRIKKEQFKGAVIIAVHHPPYVAEIKDEANPAKPKKAKATGNHGGSPAMLADIDSACQAAGVWPHAVLSGHAHNYQRFTREMGGRETPFIICGNSGHACNRLTRKGTPTIRTPMAQPSLSTKDSVVTFESYDDQHYGYLRIVANAQQLRIEYHPASDGDEAKTPDDSVTVDLTTYKLGHFKLA